MHAFRRMSPTDTLPRMRVVCQDFKSAATGVTAKAMRAELNKLVQGIDPKERDYKSVGAARSLSIRRAFQG